MALKVWLPLTQDLRNQGTDNIVIVNNGATLDDNGKLGKCYSFNGTSTKITNTFPNTISSPIGSLACWLKMNALPATGKWYCLLQIGTLGGYANCQFGLYIQYNNQIVISIKGSSGTGNVYTHSLQANQWYHLCTTFDGTIVKLYINGIEIFSKTATVGSYTTASQNLYIGGTNNFYLNGFLNDARYYDHCLSPTEIKEISRGLVCHYKLSDNNTNLYDFQTIANKWVTGGVTKADYIDPQYGNVLKITTSTANKRIYRSVTNIWTQGQVYTVSFLAKAETNGTVVNMSRSIADFTPNFTLTTDWKWYSGKITSTATADAGTLSFKIVSSSGTVYLTNVKLEKGEIATPYTPGPGDPLYNALGYNSNSIIDNSGVNNNNGIITGTLASSSDTSRYSSSVVFSGNQRIEADSLPSETKTISFWIKTAYAIRPETTSYQIAFIDDNTKLAVGFAPLGIATYVGSSAGGSGSYVKTSTLYNINQWNHIAIIKTGNTTRIVYINGQQSKNAVNGYLNNGSNNLVFGCRHYTNGQIINYFEGQLSDFRAYTTQLSEADILELYKMGAKIDSKNKFHTYELVEDSSTIKINKKGQLQINELNETTGINFDSTKDLNANELIEI